MITKNIFKIVILVYIVNIILPISIVMATGSDYTNIDMERNYCSLDQYELVYIKASNNVSESDSNVRVGVAKHINCFDTYYQAKEEMDKIEYDATNTASILHARTKQTSSTASTMVMDIIDTKYGFVDLTTKPYVGNNTYLYKNVTDKSSYTYINGVTAGDGAFIEYDYANDSAKIMISGFTGWVKKVDIDGYDAYNIVPISLLQSPSYYNVSNGEISHIISIHPCRVTSNYFTSITLGVISELNAGKYYSFDGNYFYSKIETMLEDYKNSTFENSVNYNQPYYNYIQFLPYRSQSLLDADAFNQFIINRGYVMPTTFTAYSNESLMYGQGSNFVESSNYYGTNAGLTFSIAINESAYGRSSIAMTKNNLFGHAAYDMNPGESSAGYSSVKASIDYHNFGYVSFGYLDKNDSRYFGSHVGNKNSGINVKYASDPYWGEKATAIYYRVLKESGFSDIGNDQIGIKLDEYVAIKTEANSSSKTITDYNNTVFGNITNIPIIILEEIVGESINGNNIWYKVIVDTKLDENKNVIDIDGNPNISFDSAIVTSSFDYEHNVGYIHSANIWTKDNSAPVISVEDKSIYVNDTFDPMYEVVGTDKEDGDITNKIVIISNNVDVTKAGVYTILYSLTDSAYKNTTVSINITVKTNEPPKIYVEDTFVLQYKEISLKDLATAIDLEDGDISNKITISGEVDFTIVGVYKITYEVIDSDGNKVTKISNIIVEANSNPIITGEHVNLKTGDIFDPLANVTAFDKEDGDITETIIIESNNVNVNVPGKYNIVYKVIDSDGNITRLEIIVIVDGDYIEQDGVFHFEKLEFNEGKMEVQGFLTINGINNKLSDLITYDLIFVDQNNESNIYEYELNRMLNDYPFEINLGDNYDNKGAWFNGNIDISSLPSGDYNIYIRSRNQGYEVTTLLKNIFSKDMVRKAEYNNRGYLFKVDYYQRQTPIYLSIRNNGLIGDSVPPTLDNMFNSYFNINFENNLLNIKGTSFNVGVDYGENVDVNRYLILENIDTKEQYKYEVGSIVNGNYAVTLRLDDGLSKLRAWYDASVDVSNLPSGSYSIIVNTQVNGFSDYGEVTDVFSVSQFSSTEINNRSFSVSRNDDIRYRMELTIK